MKQSAHSNGPIHENLSSNSSFRRIDIREAFSIFFRRRLLGGLIVLATLAGVVIGNYLVYPAYETKALILVERTTGAEIPFFREQIAFRKSEITQTQCELLVSSPVIEETVRRLNLDQRPKPAESLRDSVHELGRRIVAKCQNLKFEAKRLVINRVFGKTVNPPRAPDPFYEAVESLRANVQAEPLPSTDIIGVMVSDCEPEMAAKIANTMSDVYLERDLAHQRARARQVYELIEVQVATFKPKYDAAEKAVENFEEQHQARLLEEKIRSKIQEISTLEVSHGELVGSQDSRLLSLALEVARLEKTYSTTHSKVMAARSELEEARRHLLVRANTQPSENPGSQTFRISAMIARIDQSKQELSELTQLDAAYARLLHKKEQQEGLYTYLKKKREEARIAEATRATGTRVVQPASVVRNPSHPRKRLNLLLGLMGGLLAAAGVCAVLEFLDRSVRTPAQVALAVGTDVIGSLPDRRRASLRRNGLIRDYQSRSPLARAYVNLFEQSCLAVGQESCPLILVTSPSRGDGRTTIAANLASCCASLGGRNTLLIDADLERPALMKLFGVEGDKGLAQVLQGELEWKEIVKPIGEDKLSLLAAGKGPTSSLVAAQPDRLANLVAQWRSQFDWIIVDMPPVLSSASAITLGRYATGALLVVQAGRTRTEVVCEAASRLQEAQVRSLGVVLNRRRFVIPRYAYRRL